MEQRGRGWRRRAAFGVAAVLGALALAAGADDEAAKSFRFTIELPRKAAAGKPAEVTVRLRPKGRYKINMDFPFKLSVTPPAGASMGKKVLTKKDAERYTEKEARLRVPFTPSIKGKLRFGAECRFAICIAEACFPRTEALTWIVEAR